MDYCLQLFIFLLLKFLDKIRSWHSCSGVKGISKPLSTALTAYNDVFNYTDHLGNVRVSYTLDPADNAVKIMEENHYYPFGLKHNGYSPTQKIFVKSTPPSIVLTPVEKPEDVTYKYKYNGKELQDELGLDLYDYGARNYDPAIGRWLNIDPLAETSRRFSPYVYALNNPVYFIDPDGMEATQSDVDMTDLNANLSINVKPEPETPIDPPRRSGPSGGIAPKDTRRLGNEMGNYTPSSETSSHFAVAGELLKDVFDFELSTEASYGFEGSVKLGPASGSLSATGVSGSVAVTKEGVEISGSALDLSAEVSIGPKNDSGSIKGNVGITAVEGKVNINNNGKVTASGDGFARKGDATMGKGPLNVKASNSSTVGWSGKAFGVKVGLSANLYKAGAGVVKLVEGAVSYTKDVISNLLSWE